MILHKSVKPKKCLPIFFFLLLTNRLMNRNRDSGNKSYSSSGVNFTNMFTSSFYACRSQKYSHVISVFMHFWDLHELLVKCWWNWPHIIHKGSHSTKIIFPSYKIGDRDGGEGYRGLRRRGEIETSKLQPKRINVQGSDLWGERST